MEVRQGLDVIVSKFLAEILKLLGTIIGATITAEGYRDAKLEHESF